MSEIITVKAEDIRKLLKEAEISVTTQFDKVTVVCVKLKSGFVITEAAGAVDPRNYSEEIGKEVCLERIERKLWEMEGYALQKKHPVTAVTDTAIPNGYKQYIGTKLIQAAPALRIEDGDGNVRVELLADKPVTQPTDTVDMGYKVIYPDGYESWSPQDAFEAAYRETTGMNFGLAVEAAKMGKRIARRGWNGEGMWVIYRTGYPDGIPCNKNTADAVGIPEGTLFKVRPYLQMKCVDGSFQMWLASQTDMLADDWYIVE